MHNIPLYMRPYITNVKCIYYIAKTSSNLLNANLTPWFSVKLLWNNVYYEKRYTNKSHKMYCTKKKDLFSHQINILQSIKSKLHYYVPNLKLISKKKEVSVRFCFGAISKIVTRWHSNSIDLLMHFPVKIRNYTCYTFLSQYYF